MSATATTPTAITAACVCGVVHDEPRSFYVTIFDRTDNAGHGKVRLACGPYATHPEALDRVEIARRIAEKLDPRTVFYAWGTSSFPVEETTRPALTDYVEKELAESESTENSCSAS